MGMDWGAVFGTCIAIFAMIFSGGLAIILLIWIGDKLVGRF